MSASQTFCQTQDPLGDLSNIQTLLKAKSIEETDLSIVQSIHQKRGAETNMYVSPKCKADIIIIIINPLTARIVGAPQMILQPVFSIFPCSPLPSGLVELQTCPCRPPEPESKHRADLQTTKNKVQRLTCLPLRLCTSCFTLAKRRMRRSAFCACCNQLLCRSM